MKIKQIITRRGAKHLSYWDVVFEWEDELAKGLGCNFYRQCPLTDKRLFEKFINKFPRLYFLFQTTKLSFVFEMSDCRQSGINNFHNIIPCVIDSYPNRFSINEFRHQYWRNKVVLFTSRQVYDYYSMQPLNIKVFHLPISISSKYTITPSTHFEKKYDAAFVGRPNPILQRYLFTYSESHPNFIYIYHNGPEENHTFHYQASNGEYIGELESRDEYMEILRQTRVCLYSTSGMDSDKFLDNNCIVDTAQYHQVTPRFLEMLACGCHIIARYEKNSDTDYFELEKFCKSIETYRDFEIKMNSYLNMDVNMEMYSNYLSKHYTSKRAQELSELLQSIQ